MLNKKYIILVIVCALSFICLGVLSTRLSPAKSKGEDTPTPPPAKIAKHPHYHVGFQIYIDGVLQDYSGLRYMHLKPCIADDASGHDTDTAREAEDEAIERAHLHDGDGDVVHMHRDSVMWSDLLRYLEVDPADRPVSLYIDGILQPDTDAPVKPYMSAQFFIGSVPENISQLIDARVTKDRILAVEKKSESCGQD